MQSRDVRLSITSTQKQILEGLRARLDTTLSKISRSVINYGFRQIEGLDPAAARVLFDPAAARGGEPRKISIHVRVLAEDVEAIDRWYYELLSGAGAAYVATGWVLAYGIQLLEHETDSFLQFLLEQEVEYERERGLRRGRRHRVWS